MNAQELKLALMVSSISRTDNQTDCIINYCTALRQAVKSESKRDTFITLAKTYLETQCKIVKTTGKITADFSASVIINKSDEDRVKMISHKDSQYKL